MIPDRQTSARKSGPSFETKVRARIAETAVDNWDGEGGCAIPVERWNSVVAIVQRASAFPELPEPHPSASGDGTVYLRWARGGCVFDAEFAPNGRVYWTRKRGTGLASGDTGSPTDLLEQLRKTFD